MKIPEITDQFGSDLHATIFSYRSYKCDSVTYAHKFTYLMRIVLSTAIHTDAIYILKTLDMTNINSVNSMGWSALHFACAYCHEASTISTIKLLLDANADPRITNKYGLTPVDMAYKYSKFDVADLLKKITSVIPNTNLLCSALYNKDIDMVNMLINAGVDVNGSSNKNISPLHIAADNPIIENYDVIKLLIDANAKVNASDNHGYIPLCYALINVKPAIEIIQLLLDAGSNVNQPTIHNFTAIHLSNDVNIVKLLIDANADVNVITKTAQSALYMAAINEEIDLMYLLINAGANINNVLDNHDIPCLRNIYNNMQQNRIKRASCHNI